MGLTGQLGAGGPRYEATEPCAMAAARGGAEVYPGMCFFCDRSDGDDDEAGDQRGPPGVFRGVPFPFHKV